MRFKIKTWFVKKRKEFAEKKKNRVKTKLNILENQHRTLRAKYIKAVGEEFDTIIKKWSGMSIDNKYDLLKGTVEKHPSFKLHKVITNLPMKGVSMETITKLKKIHADRRQALKEV